jgi:hypothetical protein
MLGLQRIRDEMEISAGRLEDWLEAILQCEPHEANIGSPNSALVCADVTHVVAAVEEKESVSLSHSLDQSNHFAGSGSSG